MGPPAVCRGPGDLRRPHGRKWLLPVVALLAMPVLWWGSLSVLIGCVALERERIQSAVVNALAKIPMAADDFRAGSPTARAASCPNRKAELPTSPAVPEIKERGRAPARPTPPRQPVLEATPARPGGNSTR